MRSRNARSRVLSGNALSSRLRLNVSWLTSTIRRRRPERRETIHISAHRNTLPDARFGLVCLKTPATSAAAFLLALLCLGCGRNACSLHGAVKYNGELLPDGNIRLDPIDNPDAARASALIQSGQFEIPREAGLISGKYRVAVWAVRPTGRKVVARESLHGETVQRIMEEEQYIPEQYNRRSTLHIELAPGENTQEIQLVDEQETPRDNR